MREVSKLRTGPAAVICSSVQTPPPPQSKPDWQGAPGVVPRVQTPGSGAPGSGNFRKSGGACGIGEVLSGLVFCVKPVKPVSPPPLNGEPPFGSLNGPKVRCRGTRLNGSIPSPPGKYCDEVERENTVYGQPPR